MAYSFTAVTVRAEACGVNPGQAHGRAFNRHLDLMLEEMYGFFAAHGKLDDPID